VSLSGQGQIASCSSCRHGRSETSRTLPELPDLNSSPTSCAPGWPGAPAHLLLGRPSTPCAHLVPARRPLVRVLLLPNPRLPEYTPPPESRHLDAGAFERAGGAAVGSLLVGEHELKRHTHRRAKPHLPERRRAPRTDEVRGDVVGEEGRCVEGEALDLRRGGVK